MLLVIEIAIVNAFVDAELYIGQTESFVVKNMEN